MASFLARDFHRLKVTGLFYRSLVFLTIVKILLLWSFSREVMNHHTISLPRSWIGKIILAPAFVANENVDIFFGGAILILLPVLFLKRHYITTTLFFWLTFNLYIVYLPFANGSDIVLFMLALWCIPIATRPSFQSETAKNIQKAIFNTAVLMCQLQVVFIYLVSGWDKLISEAWRSGQAIAYVTHLNTMFNPLFSGVFDNPSVQFTLSWMTILFELVFGVFVWFNQTRIPILIAGLFFHLFIWVVLSLPDFASTMMVSYILFLKESDLKRFTFIRRFQH